MANEFIIRKGYKSLASSEITGSLNVSGNIYGERVYVQGKKALDSSSNFLYIDPNTQFGSGIYINNAVKIDGGLLGSYNEDLQLRTGGDTRITIASADGAIRFHNYGAGYLKTDSSGNITVDTSTIEDTLDSVTDRGATTTNAISTGNITANGSILGGGNLFLRSYNNDPKGIFFRDGFEYGDTNQYNLSITIYDDGDGAADGMNINAYDGIFLNVHSGTTPSTAFRVLNTEVRSYKNFVSTGTITAATSFIADAVSTSNNDPGTDNVQVSGYGMIGNRGNLYITNANTDSAANVQIGVGGVHNGSPKLSIGATVSTISTNLHPGADSTYNIGSNASRFANGYFDALHTKGTIQNNTAAYINYISNQGHRFYVDANGDDTSHKFEILSNTTTYAANNVVVSINQSGDAIFDGDVTGVTFRADNNESYYAKDSSGTSRRLIRYGTDDNVYIGNQIGDLYYQDPSGTHEVYHEGHKPTLAELGAAADTVVNQTDFVSKANGGTFSGPITINTSTTPGLIVKSSGNSGQDQILVVRGSRNDPSAGVEPAKIQLQSYDDDDDVNKVGGEFYMEATSETGTGLTDFEVGIRYRKDGSVIDGFKIHDGEAVVNGNLTATSLVKSGGASTEFLKADGSVDTSTYLTTLPTHNHDGRYLRTHARYSDDLDTINSSGVYIWDVSEADDEPTGASDGLLTIKYWDSTNWATANFQDFHANKLYIKSKQSGTWQTDWAQVWTTDQLTTTNKTNYDTAYTYSQVGHLPLAGGTLTGNLTVDIDDGGSAPAMTNTLRLKGYGGRGAGIKIQDSVNSATSPSSREWFIGSGYNNSGFNIGYASDGVQSSYNAQSIFNLGTNGNAYFAGNINLTGGGVIEAPSVSGAEKLTLKAAGGLDFIIDSNGNGGDDQYFKVMKHTDTEIFSVKETGLASFTGDIILGANHIGRDADNYVGFESDNQIKFRVNGATQVKLVDGALNPQTDSDIDLGTNTLRYKNIYADNIYGSAQDLAVTSNDTFSGTYGLLWHDGADVYSSSWLTVAGATDTLNVPNISTTGDVEVSGYLQVNSSAALLKKYVSGWTTGVQTHDILYNGWNSTVSDYTYLKAAGNGTGGHGIIVAGDTGTYMGTTDIETGVIADSATAPLTNTWAYFRDTTAYIKGDTSFAGDVVVAGTLTAQEFHTEFVSASIIYESGSTKFGDTSDDSHDFTGSVNIDGTLSATVKSFDIEHPTQVGKRLVYGVLEGPEHAVYVRGESKEDTVILPEEWEGLIDKDTITVQLTSIGTPDIYYYKTYENNSIIVGGPQEKHYFYYVQATRKDVEPLITVQ